jgi:hypothetical protein
LISKPGLKSTLFDSINIRSYRADSKTTSRNEVRRAQFSLSSFTDRGRKIDFNDAQSESAFAPIRVSFDPDSNINDESHQQYEKASSPRNSTDAGRQIDFNDEQPENV